MSIVHRDAFPEFRTDVDQKNRSGVDLRRTAGRDLERRGETGQLRRVGDRRENVDVEPMAGSDERQSHGHLGRFG
jgi:hypothetical protein